MGNFTVKDLAYLETVEETGIVRDGMILHLDAGNRKSYRGVGTLVTDLSGRGFNGTLSGPVTWTPLYGGVFSFNGSSTWIDTALNIDAEPVTICAWFYCLNSASANGTVVAGTDNGGWDKGFGTISSQWEIHTGNNQAVSSTYAPSNSRWYYGCQFYTASSQGLYINMVSVYSAGAPGGDVGEPLEIGRSWYNGGAGSRWFQGYISNVQVYNRQLSLAEISQNYNAIKWRYGL
jgi:hypothetical protein